MDVRDKLNGIFQEVFKDDGIQITSGMTANDVEGWDSFSQVTLIVAVETRFNIKFSLKEIMSLKNVGDLLKNISSKITT